jgi:hypothetical protein
MAEFVIRAQFREAKSIDALTLAKNRNKMADLTVEAIRHFLQTVPGKRYMELITGGEWEKLMRQGRRPAKKVPRDDKGVREVTVPLQGASPAPEMPRRPDPLPEAAVGSRCEVETVVRVAQQPELADRPAPHGPVLAQTPKSVNSFFAKRSAAGQQKE